MLLKWHSMVKYDSQIPCTLRWLDDGISDSDWKSAPVCRSGKNNKKLGLLLVQLEHVFLHPATHGSNTTSHGRRQSDGTLIHCSIFPLRFDTIDHSILLRRPEDWVGVTGRAHDWLRSYLTGRSQQVKLGECLSRKVDLPFGVPQGSVLDLLVFTIYTTPLSQVVSQYDISHHFYADDSQLYVSFSSRNSAVSLSNLKSCLDSVQLWMSGNKPKLNPDKTEFLLIGHERQRSKYLAMFPDDFLGLQTTSAKPARNSGVIFDTNNFSFRSHVSAVCRSCRYHIRDLRRVHRYLSFDSAKLLAHAFVSSRLDDCNSLLFRTADKEIIQLQRIQNSLLVLLLRNYLWPAVFHYYTLPPLAASKIQDRI